MDEFKQLAGKILKDYAKIKKGRFSYIIMREHSIKTIKHLIKKAGLNPEGIIIKEGKFSLQEKENIDNIFKNT